MQVAVSPSHYNLKDIVQAIEVDTSGYLNTPPNGRFAATQSNFEFVKGQGNGRDHWIRLNSNKGTKSDIEIAPAERVLDRFSSRFFSPSCRDRLQSCGSHGR